MSVLVRDGGVPALSGTTVILCTVGDENDHAPEIVVPRDDIEVLENQEPGLVYTVLASDMDAGSNGAVTYHIIGKYHLYFNSPWDTSMVDAYVMVSNLHSVHSSMSTEHTPDKNWLMPRLSSPPPSTSYPDPLPSKVLKYLPSTTLVVSNPFTLKDIQMKQIAFLLFSLFSYDPLFLLFWAIRPRDMSRKAVFWDLQTNETLQIYHNTPEINQGL